MQLKLFAIYLPVGVMIVSLILFSQVSTAAASAELMDKEDDEDKAIKQELGTSETNPNDDNRGKQEEEEEAAEEQESNDDTSESEDNVMIDDDGDGGDNINPSEDDDDDDDDDDVPFKLPFDNTIPFP
jgi:hypothetical protein